MRTIVVLTLFLTLGFQLVARLGIVALYEVNKEYIAKNLCENRAKPKLQCNGKCYLKKQLKKADESQESNNGPVSQSETLLLSVFIVPDFWNAPRSFEEQTILKHSGFYQSISGIDNLKDIFHPPQSV